MLLTFITRITFCKDVRFRFWHFSRASDKANIWELHISTPYEFLVRARDHCVFFVINSCYSLGILCTSPQPRTVSFDCSIGSLKRRTKKKVKCAIMELMIVYLGCWVLVVQCLLFCVLRMVFSIVELSPVFRRAKHQDTKLETWYQ